MVYELLTTEPKRYRIFAKGFMQKNRLPGGIPKDEFHKVLKSQISREAMLDSSRHNTTGEEALFNARMILLSAIIKDYLSVQETVIGGGDPPEGAARIGFRRAK